MGQHSPVDIRRAFGILSTALAAVAVLLGASVLRPTSSIAAGTQADSVTIDSLEVFGAANGATQEVAAATVVNHGTAPVTIGGIRFASRTGTVTGVQIFPGENCSNTTIPAGGYCVISVAVTPGVPVNGDQVIVTMGDNSTKNTLIFESSESNLDTLVADPYVVAFGSRKVGTTSPAQQITVNAAPSDFEYAVVKVSVVDAQASPAAFADYHVTADGCTGQDLLLAGNEGNIPASCAISVTDTPGAAGSRPAYLSIAYCGFPVIESRRHTLIGAAVRPAALPNDPAPGCPDEEGVTAFHVLVSLTGTGTVVTTTPPPNQTFNPALTASPPLSPAGRTTLVSGTGYPANATVNLALVPLGTPATTDPTTVPGFATVTADGSGAFSNHLLLIMPHTTPGQYEILGSAPGAVATLGFLVAPGTQEPPKFVTRH